MNFSWIVKLSPFGNPCGARAEKPVSCFITFRRGGACFAHPPREEATVIIKYRSSTTGGSCLRMVRKTTKIAGVEAAVGSLLVRLLHFLDD